MEACGEVDKILVNEGPKLGLLFAGAMHIDFIASKTQNSQTASQTWYDFSHKGSLMQFHGT